MDRISALRNMEDALQDYEDGDVDLAGLEERIGTILRTYATDFEAAELDVYRAVGGEADGTIVAAESATEARERIGDQLDVDDLEFDLEQMG